MHLFVIGMDMFVQNTTLFNFHIHRAVGQLFTLIDRGWFKREECWLFAKYKRHRESTHQHSHD